MKVTEIISDTNIGGAGVLLCTRLKYTDMQEFRTSVILPERSQLKNRLEQLHVPVYEASACADRSWSLRGVRSHIRILRTLQPDLVNCHASLTGRVAAKLCGVPSVIYTRHCVFPLKKWQRTLPGKLLLSIGQNLLQDHAIAVAHSAKENLIALGVRPNRIHVIINGVEEKEKYSKDKRERYKATLGYPKESFVVGICGRLESCKGHRELLNAAQILLSRDKKIRFLIVGDGTQRRSLQLECIKRGLSPYVTFTGFVADVTPYLNVMDLQVNCSRGSETSSLALSEGMSLGIPMVVSSFGGNPYMVRHGENGFVYPVGSAHALAERIWEIKQNPSLYRHMSKKAYERFRKELNAEAMTQKTARVYRAAMQGRIKRKLSVLPKGDK